MSTRSTSAMLSPPASQCTNAAPSIGAASLGQTSVHASVSTWVPLSDVKRSRRLVHAVPTGAPRSGSWLWKGAHTGLPQVCRGDHHVDVWLQVVAAVGLQRLEARHDLRGAKCQRALQRAGVDRVVDDEHDVDQGLVAGRGRCVLDPIGQAADGRLVVMAAHRLQAATLFAIGIERLAHLAQANRRQRLHGLGVEGRRFSGRAAGLTSVVLPSLPSLSVLEVSSNARGGRVSIGRRVGHRGVGIVDTRCSASRSPPPSPTIPPRARTPAPTILPVQSRSNIHALPCMDSIRTARAVQATRGGLLRGCVARSELHRRSIGRELFARDDIVVVACPRIRCHKVNVRRALPPRTV